MSRHLERASLLIGQSRYELAEQGLPLCLAENPDDPLGDALLAQCPARCAACIKAALAVPAPCAARMSFWAAAIGIEIAGAYLCTATPRK